MSTIVLRCSLGDLDVSSLASFRLFLRGNWQAVCGIGWPEAPPVGDACSLRFTREDGTEDVFIGHVRRRSLTPGTEALSVTIAGGAGKLLAPDLPARHHTAGNSTVPAGLVARGIADAAGETLAAGVEAALDGHALARWTRLAGPARDAVDTLAGVLGLGWRILDTGELLIGAETFPDATDDALSRAFFRSGAPEDGAIFYTTDGAPLRPGTTVNGAAAIEVCYHVDSMSPDATQHYLQAEVRTAQPGDPVYAPDLRHYHASYAGTVRDQESDGTLHIACDDPRVGDDLRGIPLRVGLPGCKVDVPADYRLRVCFENGDPRGAYATGAIDQDPNASHQLALKDDKSNCGTLTATVVGVKAGPDTIAVTFNYVGPFTGYVGTSPILEGKIIGPCHKFAKGIASDE